MGLSWEVGVVFPVVGFLFGTRNQQLWPPDINPGTAFSKERELRVALQA